MTSAAQRQALTLVDLIDLRARTQPSQRMLVDPQDQELSWAEFRAASLGAAAHLKEQGVGAGARVVTVAENSLELFVLIVGAWRLGAILVPLNPSQTLDWISATIAQADPVLVVADEGVSVPGWAVQSFPHLDLEPSDQTPGLGPGTPESAALIIFSSGTTGHSKGCVLSHAYLTFFGGEFALMAGLTDADRVMCVTALYHVNAFWAFSGSVVNGTPHAFEKKFSASRFWQRVVAIEATVFDYVGAIIAILLRSNEERPRECKMRAGLGGGAREREVIEFERRFGCAVLEGYGLTECAQPIYQRLEDRKVGSIGRVSAHFEALVVDSEGRDVADEETGELWLRPLQETGMFSEYWRDSQATEDAFHDEWFRTRDLVRRDSDGYFYFVERAGDVIRRRGESISAFELEGIFASHPCVRIVAAVPVPSELGDDEILIAAELVEGAALTPSALLEWVRPRLAPFMTPRFIRFGKLPCTASQRIERYKVRSLGVTPDTYDASHQEVGI